MKETKHGAANDAEDDMAFPSSSDVPLPSEEERIEIDFDMISGAKAKRVKHLYINERFMKTGVNKTNLSVRDLKRIFVDLEQLKNNSVETVHVELDTTEISGSMLASAVFPQLTTLEVQSGLVLIHQDDRTALGKVIYEHEFLNEITLHNLVVKERLLNRFNKNPAPPMDILIPAFTSITFLNSLELSCKPPSAVSITATATKPTTTAAAANINANTSTNINRILTTSNMLGGGTNIQRPMLSFLGIKELFQTLTLERLELTHMGLTDDHFGVIVEQLSQQSSSSCLKELILNENNQTDTGMDMMATLLSKNDCKLEYLECYQTDSVVVGTSVTLFESALEENTTLQHLRIHLWGDDDVMGTMMATTSTTTTGKKKSKSTSSDNGMGMTKKGKIPFYLNLNRKGRKLLFNKRNIISSVKPRIANDQWMDLICDVKDDPSQLFYCLKNSGYWWRYMSMPNLRPDGFSFPTEHTTKNIHSTSSSPELISPLGAGASRTSRRSTARLMELKSRHGDILTTLDLKNDSKEKDLDDNDGGDDDEGATHSGKGINNKNDDNSITQELSRLKLPEYLSIPDDQHEDEALHNSVISLGAESYVNDLLHQKQKRPMEAREEVLEDALEELDYVIENDKLPPGMSKEYYFHRVLERLTKEKTKEMAKEEKARDTLLEEVLIKEAAKEIEKQHQSDATAVASTAKKAPTNTTTSSSNANDKRH